MATDIDVENKPLVTFIVTDYNLPVAFLRECLDSILAVSLEDDEREVILVDDGSRDPIRPLLSDYKQFVRFFRQTNQGLSAARNLGIEHAQGRYIQFVDGDDCIIPHYYNKVVERLRENLNDIVLFQFTSKQDYQVTSMKVVKGTTVSWAQRNNLRASAWGYAFKMELLNSGLRFTPGIYHEDEEFTPLLFDASATICELSLPAYYYRQREGSITNNASQEHLEKRFADLLSVILMLREKARESDSYLLTRRYRQLTMDFLYNVMQLFGNPSVTEQYVDKLQVEGLFPLFVTKAYTRKYWLFAQATRFRSVRNAMSLKLKK